MCRSISNATRITRIGKRRHDERCFELLSIKSIVKSAVRGLDSTHNVTNSSPVRAVYYSALNGANSET